MNTIKHYFSELKRMMFIMPKNKSLRAVIFFTGMVVPYVLGQFILRPHDQVSEIILMIMIIVSIFAGYFGKFDSK
ncbi:hypothetical protein [Shewanella gaetbuli]